MLWIRLLVSCGILALGWIVGTRCGESNRNSFRRPIVAAPGDHVTLTSLAPVLLRVGEIEHAGTTTASLRFVNATSAPLEVLGTRSTCPCVAPAVRGGPSVSPGGEFAIDFEIRLDERTPQSAGGVFIDMEVETADGPRRRSVLVAPRAWLLGHELEPEWMQAVPQ